MDFFACYAPYARTNEPVCVVDIGSQDINGSLRNVCPKAFSYTGVDFAAGPGVDIVLNDPYSLPMSTGSIDLVLSSSCFEHAQMFWLLFLEVLRVLKPGGLFYLNVPSNGDFHRWPVDCWRFYPDSGRALVAWAKRNGIQAALLESYTSMQIGDQWNDFVAVFIRDEARITHFPKRIIDTKEAYTNGLRYEDNEVRKYSLMPEDKKKLVAISQICSNQIKLY